MTVMWIMKNCYIRREPPVSGNCCRETWAERMRRVGPLRAHTLSIVYEYYGARGVCTSNSFLNNKGSKRRKKA